MTVENSKPVAAVKPTYEELLARLAAFEAGERKPNTLSFKVSEKSGAVSVYGLGRLPATLYASQWERVAESMPRLLAFIKANEATVARKAAK